METSGSGGSHGRSYGRQFSVELERVEESGADVILDVEFLGAEGPWDEPGTLALRVQFLTMGSVVYVDDSGEVAVWPPRKSRSKRRG
jgi:hypothetical protein